ncbi:hypothetical protein QFC22_005978 [Naganishia vaughanmartiniae]|uniref:Uncharacterized protein n=1 Tax=Naganishia vaughanmartiniae TaxID=1424756 RepID=A0ACC2WR73_9TREE|nr:hypothetical protein QFC22_005978 [Naganishia vaughanmartiniae]
MSDAKVLDKHIDFGDAHYGEQRAGKVALAHLLHKELGKSGILTKDMADLVHQLKKSLWTADSIEIITLSYIEVLKEIELDLAAAVLEEKVEEILWTYIFEPITEIGVANRSSGKRAQAAGDEHADPAHGISSRASWYLPPSGAVSGTRKDSCLPRLSTEVATAAVSRAVTKLKQSKYGEAAHEARSRYRRRLKQAIVNGRYHPESRLSQTTNVSDSDDPLPKRDTSNDRSPDELSTSAVATTATPTASTTD